ncbi:hypothetical protein O1611_g5964 [Lasiodiplodia mahajangana]|uniref:Uncharacterized protein n=1 Tax=Lasiodiplodia mahajangana TaxID=1108764 RepID=A0ACC2JJF5_9PEZI|nr:hypothetical protein O1611_g5964 [Lasiodiplodia mahajangana]
MSQLLNTTKRDLLGALYQVEVGLDDESFQEYFDFFEMLEKEECPGNLGTESLAQLIIKVVKDMKDKPSATRPYMRDRLRGEMQENSESPMDNERLDAILGIALRIWLMIDLTHMSEFWKDSQGLCDSIYGLFYPNKPAPSFMIHAGTINNEAAAQAELAIFRAEESASIQSRLTHDMTAANLSRLTKMKIEWTGYLNRNLQFDAEFRRLSIFYRNRWLFDTVTMVKRWQEEQMKREQENQDTTGRGSVEETSAGSRNLPPFPIPLEVLEEALKALNFLLPPYDASTRLFLRKERRSLYDFRLEHFEELGDRNKSKVRLKDFVYYHDRLVELAYEYLNPPKSWGTIWRDYRNPAQYWTFWIGLVIFIATLVFGVLSSVLAGVQIYYAQHPSG